MRVGIRDAERLKDSPSSAPVCALGHLPPWGGRLWGCSNREGLIPLWDVWIHILGIWVKCACLGDGRPSVPPLRRRRGKPGRRVREAAPYKRCGSRPRPCGGVWAKNAGAQCAPLQERGRETAPSSVWPTASHLPPRGKAWEKQKGTGLEPIP